MKIILAHKYYYQRGGAETYVLALEKLLKDHGHTVIPFAMHHPRNKTSKYSKYFVSEMDMRSHKGIGGKMKVAMRTIYSREAKEKFTQLLQDTQPDIVHINNIYHHISPSILDVCKQAGVPVVQTVHDFKLICPNYSLYCNGHIDESCKGGKFYKDALNKCVQDSYVASSLVALEMYIHKWLKIYQKNICAWIVPSQFTKEKLVEFGMPKNRLHVMYHFLRGGPTKQIEPKDYLLVAGRLSEEKGFADVIRALKHGQWKLKIAGEGPQEDQLKRLAQTEGVGEQIDWLGHVTGKKLERLMGQAALVIVPTRTYETFGYSTVESFVQGTPVIGTDIGATKELIGAIDKKLLFKPDNPDDMARAIGYALKQGKRSSSLAKREKKFVKDNLDPEEYYTKLIQLYKKVIRSCSQ